MAQMTLTKTRIHAGVWEGVLTVSAQDTDAPEVEVLHLGMPLRGVEITADDAEPGRFLLRVTIPATLLSEGVQTFIIQDRDSGERLDSFTVVTGQPMEDDLRAELDLLRAELDLVKRALRRHVVGASAQ